MVTTDISSDVRNDLGLGDEGDGGSPVLAQHHLRHQRGHHGHEWPPHLFPLKIVNNNVEKLLNTILATEQGTGSLDDTGSAKLFVDLKYWAQEIGIRIS